ncbi:MAG TPA: transcriptional repressor [Mycobacterium sp.]|uniref:Fur family transcriptional regulator n=1 Tax=Mycobacterium sp. TaxID=1785 RepID=UPI002BBF725B|nr:transcriptional repressor [Mycobacterium sp.]HME77804.1 transcriptional repressor [Mycobacterium sp.]
MPAPPAPRRPRRPTVKQQAVVKALRRSDRFRSAQQLHHELGEHRPVRVGLTTVYRILHTLAEKHIAEAQRGEDGEILYRLRTTAAHRHYLLCRRCGDAVAFSPGALEHHTAELARQHCYTDVTHHIDLYGTCPRCGDP